MYCTTEKRIIKSAGTVALNQIINHDLIKSGKIKILKFELYDDLSAAAIDLTNEKHDWVVSISVMLYVNATDHDTVIQAFKYDDYLNGDDEFDMGVPAFKYVDIDNILTCLVNSDFSQPDWYYHE